MKELLRQMADRSAQQTREQLIRENLGIKKVQTCIHAASRAGSSFIMIGSSIVANTERNRTYFGRP